MNITVFLGAPGSGKGTQAKRLSTAHGFKHFSTGDMLRVAIQEEKPVGLKAKGFMDKGELVPDSIMIELIEEALSHVSGTAKVLLDGFPRTVAQAKALDSNPRTQVSLALYFIVPEETLIRRLTGRRICKKCGESFHLEFMPPKANSICDKCGSQLTQRPDDSESVARHRLTVFRSQNEGLLSYYTSAKKLKEIAADNNVDEIQNTLAGILK